MLNKQRGLSLIELMIVLLVSSIILVGVLTVVGNVLNESSKSLQKQRLNYELQNILEFITRDVRRAGYWNNAINDVNTGVNTNPYMTTASINIVGNECILLGYDIDSNGLLPALNSGSDDERYGYRYDTTDKTVEGRTLTSNYSCITANGWDDITDPTILQISNLTFTQTIYPIDFDADPTTPATINKNRINISVTGNLVQDASLVLTLNKTIYVYNSNYVP